MNITHLFFDFDGVIADSLEANMKAWGAMLKFINKDVFLDKAEIRERWDGDWKKFYGKYLGLTDDEIEKSDGYFKKFTAENFSPAYVKRMQVVLPELASRYKLIVVSSNYSENIIAALKRFGLKKLFLKVYGDTELEGMTKPSPEAFLIPLRELGLRPHEVFTVGDSAGDIRTAHRAGLPAVAVTWGWNSREQLNKENPEYIADRPEELLEIFK